MADITTSDSGLDAIQLLSRQHRDVERLWSQLQGTHGARSAAQHDQAREIVRMLSQHDALETEVLYPELRDKAGVTGERLSRHSLDGHRDVRNLLAQVDGEDISHDGIYATLARCMQVVTDHVREEEDVVFPLLRQHCGEDRLLELGKRLEKMLPVAPTHPHRAMPEGKAAATVAGTVAGLVDKARDAISGDR